VVRLEAQLGAEPLALEAGSDAGHDFVDLPWFDLSELSRFDRRLAGGSRILDARTFWIASAKPRIHVRGRIVIAGELGGL